MSKHFNLREELVMPQEQVFCKFRGDVHVHDFLYDVIDQAALFEAMEEDERLLYGKHDMIIDGDPADFDRPIEDYWEEDDWFPEQPHERYSAGTLKSFEEDLKSL